MENETNITQTIIQKRLKYFQDILKLSIQSAEQFDTKSLDYSTYYTYTPEINQFNIDLESAIALRFRDKIRRMSQDQSIAVTIRYNIRGANHPILVSYLTEENIEDGILKVRGYLFRVHSPTLMNLGFELEEITELNTKLDSLTFKEKVVELTSVLTERFEKASIVPQQFMCGVVNITSFDKIIKERVDNSVTNYKHIKESDILYKYLKMDLSSITPNRINILPIQTNLNTDQRLATEAFFGTRLQTLNGPPGTGKSQTITEFLMQAIIFEKKVLLTSYNNKPVDVVYNKIQEALGVKIPFPCYSSNIQDNFRDFFQYISNLKIMNTKRDLADKLEEIENEFNILQEKYDLLDSCKKAESRIHYLKAKYGNLLEDEHSDIHNIRDEYFKKLDFLAANAIEYDILNFEITTNLKHYSELQKNLIITKLNLNYIQIYDRDLEVLKDAAMNPNRIFQARKILEDIVEDSPIVFGNILKSINNMPNKKNFFDYIVVDEASQCNSLAIVPLLPITRSLIVIGDPKQLNHIPNPIITPKLNEDMKLVLDVTEETGFDYINTSLFSYVDEIRVKSYQQELFLSYHYRCNPDIIEFSNQNYYDNRLQVTKEPKLASINWHNIEGQGNQSNYNEVEVNAVLARVFHYIKDYSQFEIGVISQYRNQANRIKRVLIENGLTNVQVGTVHTFQGDEKKVILYSPVYSNGSTLRSLNFINVNCYNILNVAITRGQEVFEVVGDFNFAVSNFNSVNDIYYKLARFIESKR